MAQPDVAHDLVVIGAAVDRLVRNTLAHAAAVSTRAMTADEQLPEQAG